MIKVIDQNYEELDFADPESLTLVVPKSPVRIKSKTVTDRQGSRPSLSDPVPNSLVSGGGGIGSDSACLVISGRLAFLNCSAHLSEMGFAYAAVFTINSPKSN